jgi:sugar diacid utilization regulator
MRAGAPEAAALDDRLFELRTQLSNLRGLLALAMLLTESGDERQILHLATTSVDALARCHLVGVCLTRGTWYAATGVPSGPDARRDLERQLAALGVDGGAVGVPGEPWGWAYPLRGPSGPIGFLIVAAQEDPPASAQFLLRVLAQQAGLALVNARLHAQERAASERLVEVNATLQQTIHALQRSMDIHQRLTRVALSGEGQEGIARAVHELTGYPVAVEDRYGNLRAWAGPDRPDPYPKDPPAQRNEMLGRALGQTRPIREGGRLVAVAQPRGDTVGVLALVDPAGAAGEHELVALEHGATVLAMELARLRGLAETELRLRRDLVEDLLTGTDEDSALARAHALGYDLERPHWVVVVEGRGRAGADDETFFDGVRRAVRELRLGSLLVSRTGTVVVLADRAIDWEELRLSTLAELGGGRCRVGIGGRCERVGDVSRSYDEAQMALNVQAASGSDEQATSFEGLGIYRILSQAQDIGRIERFVADWIGPLVDYDARKGSELVDTLSVYLECGGSHKAATRALVIHRSTLKYRLQRIRELSGHDLNDAHTRFNLQLATRAWTTLRSMRG